MSALLVVGVIVAASVAAFLAFRFSRWLGIPKPRSLANAVSTFFNWVRGF